jgi:hypothetical protein
MNKKKTIWLQRLLGVISFFSACGILFFLALSLFNACLLSDLSNALPVVESYGKDKIPSSVISLSHNDELMFFNGDPEGCRRYLEDTKSFLFYLLRVLFLFVCIFFIAIYLRKNNRMLRP